MPPKNTAGFQEELVPKAPELLLPLAQLDPRGTSTVTSPATCPLFVRFYGGLVEATGLAEVGRIPRHHWHALGRLLACRGSSLAPTDRSAPQARAGAHDLGTCQSLKPQDVASKPCESPFFAATTRWEFSTAGESTFSAGVASKPTGSTRFNVKVAGCANMGGDGIPAHLPTPSRHKQPFMQEIITATEVASNSNAKGPCTTTKICKD